MPEKKKAAAKLPGSQQPTVRLDPELHHKAKVQAAVEKMKLQELVAKAVKRYLGLKET